MLNTTFCVSFLTDEFIVEITINGNIEKLFEFQMKENIFPLRIIFVNEDTLSGDFSRDNSKKLVHWLQKNGARYTQKG